MSFEEITCCRICKNPNLITIFDLGNHSLGSRFPSLLEADPFEVPLILVKCGGECGLLQLKHNTCQNELYLNNYGYRSGVNSSMKAHLNELVSEIETKVTFSENDIVLDIGGNDSTCMQQYSNPNLIRVIIDPTGQQFKEYYLDNIKLIPTFFSKEVFMKEFGDRKAKVITTISMLYDLPDPISFVQDIKNILDLDGIWVTEQSYCLSMIKQNSLDTICHEHLEYYTLKQLQYIADKIGLKIIDVSENSCNGGSFRVTFAHDYSEIPKFIYNEPEVTLSLLNEFVNNCENVKTTLVTYLKDQKTNGKTIYIYSASTKGNTLLQYCRIDNTLISFAVERNPDKYGRRTPGSNIPIISEEQMRKDKPDILLVLAWHFKKEFIEREKTYIENGGKMIFPLPRFEVIEKY
jgi:NDP-4-keto-2,6-dideoxyhexose 3-C-methyltransferase